MGYGNTYSSFSTFISSPSDVQRERDLTKDTLSRINGTIGDTLGMRFSRVSWEDLPPMAVNIDEQSIQEELNKLVQHCHFFILILHKKYGSVERGYTKSNTEREMDAILEKKKSDPRVTILSYFKEIKSNKDPGPQELKVRDYRERLMKNGVLRR